MLDFDVNYAKLVHQLRKDGHITVFNLPVSEHSISLHLFRYLISFTVSLLFSSYRSGFPNSSPGKESTCNAGDLGSIPGLGRSSGEGNGYPLQYSGMENSMDCTVHGSQRVGHD